ncbi:MAG: hypothetical protein RLZZ214_4283, partial [Verrucomicrobiota bacterium]
MAGQVQSVWQFTSDCKIQENPKSEFKPETRIRGFKIW